MSRFCSCVPRVCHGDGGVGMCHGDGGVGTPWLLRTRWNTECCAEGTASIRGTDGLGTLNAECHAREIVSQDETPASTHRTRNHGVESGAFGLGYVRFCTMCPYGTSPNGHVVRKRAHFPGDVPSCAPRTECQAKSGVSATKKWQRGLLPLNRIRIRQVTGWATAHEQVTVFLSILRANRERIFVPSHPVIE